MKKSNIIAVLAVLIATQAAKANYSIITDSLAGSEPHLWQVLDVVTDGAIGTSSAFLNAGAGGRRVHDRNAGITDQIWKDGEVTVTATGLFWGREAFPNDTLGQQFMYDNDLLGTSPANPSAIVDDPGDSGTFTLAPDQHFIMLDYGDSTRQAWSRESLNTMNYAGEYDRMVTFDVSGLDIYAWISGTYVAPTRTLIGNMTGPAYIVAFDPGATDTDFQDMVVLIEGAAPIPVPSTILLSSIGVGLVGWLRRRRTI